MNLIIVKVVIKLYWLNSDRHLLVTIFFFYNKWLSGESTGGFVFLLSSSLFASHTKAGSIT